MNWELIGKKLLNIYITEIHLNVHKDGRELSQYQ